MTFTHKVTLSFWKQLFGTGKEKWLTVLYDKIWLFPKMYFGTINVFTCHGNVPSMIDAGFHKGHLGRFRKQLIMGLCLPTHLISSSDFVLGPQCSTSRRKKSWVSTSKKRGPWNRAFRYTFFLRLVMYLLHAFRHTFCLYLVMCFLFRWLTGCPRSSRICITEN